MPETTTPKPREIFRSAKHEARTPAGVTRPARKAGKKPKFDADKILGDFHRIFEGLSDRQAEELERIMVHGRTR